MNYLHALYKVLGNPVVQGKEYLYYCPWHAHHKPKLSVNLEKHVWRCWICDRGGYNLLRLLRLKGETEDSRAYEKQLTPRKNHAKLEKTYQKPVLPVEFRTLTRDWDSPYYHHAMTYLAKRGITIEDIYRYKIGYCESGEYVNRVVFPSFDANGDLNFVIGRSFYQQGKPYHHGEYDKDIVFNEYLIDWENPVILVEGIFDAIVAGNNAIPRLGSSLTEDSNLFNKLLKAKDVYLSFDSDARDKQIDMAALFLQYGKRPYLVDLNGEKDPGVMSREAYGRALSLAKKVNSEFDILRLRVA